MAMYAVDSQQVAFSATRIAATSEQIRTEVASLMAELMALSASWQGAASAQFSDCIAQWQATQSQVDAALTTISNNLHAASQVYADAEAQSAALFIS